MINNYFVTSSSWGQALSLGFGLDFVDADFTDKYTIAVEYTSEKAPQIVLSGNLTSVNWVTVTPAITQSNGSTNIAYFTINNMVSIYKKAPANNGGNGNILLGF